MRQYVISTLFRGNNQLTPTVNAMSNSFRRFTGTVQQSSQRSRTALTGLNSRITATQTAIAALNAKKTDILSGRIPMAADKAATSVLRLTNDIARLENELESLNHSRANIQINSAQHGMNRGLFHTMNWMGIGHRIGSGVINTLKAFTPSWGTIAGLAAAGYVGKQILDNSSEIEQIRNRIGAGFESNPAFKGQDHETKAKDLTRRAFIAGGQNVGSELDWANFASQFVGRGVNPSDELFRSMGNLAASHKGGMTGFIETFLSGARGETAALDQIPGLQARTKGGAVTLYMNGEKYNLGAKTDSKYFQRYNTALSQISEKYFGKYGERQGKSFDAFWGSMTGKFKLMVDDMITGTSIWEQAIKPSVKGLGDAFDHLKPKLTGLSETIFQKFFGNNKLKGFGDSLEQLAGRGIDNLTKSIAAIKDDDIKQFGNNMVETGKNIFELGKAVGEALPSLKSFFAFAAHPLDTTGRALVGSVIPQGQDLDDMKQVWGALTNKGGATGSWGDPEDNPANKMIPHGRGFNGGSLSPTALVPSSKETQVNLHVNNTSEGGLIKTSVEVKTKKGYSMNKLGANGRTTVRAA